jgi:hypothetical protein
MKVLYSNGDSWTYGAEFPSETPMGDVQRHYTVWPQHLASLMGIPLVVNEAVGAGNNHRIFRRTTNFVLNWIAKNKNPADLFIVLGWTTPERSEVAVNGRYFRLTSNGVVENMHRMPKKIDDYQKLYYEFYDDDEGMFTQVRYMHTLRQLCKGLGIRYYDFIAIGEQPDEYNLLSIEKYGTRLENLYTSMTWKKHVYLNKLPVHEYGHPTVETHNDWANVLYEVLK